MDQNQNSGDTPKNKSRPEIHGGFALAHWSGRPEVEAKIKEELKFTIRCIPFDDFLGEKEPGICPFSGDPSPSASSSPKATESVRRCVGGR